MCDIDDDRGMAAAVERIHADPDLATRVVEGGRAKFRWQFTKERIVDRYIDLFNGQF